MTTRRKRPASKKKTTRKKTPARKTRASRRARGGSFFGGIVGLAVLVAAAGFVGFATYAALLGVEISREFEARRWDVPAQVFATPLELYPGRRLGLDDLVAELRRLGYREAAVADRPGRYRTRAGALDVVTRAYRYGAEEEPSRRVSIEFAGGRVARVIDASGSELPLLRFDPLQIGSVFPVHGEDRLILEPSEVPPLLIEALKAIEDRRFDEHHGIDLKGVLRAAFVNLRAGEIRQGASTLTQQLVRSYFLSNERTWTRKLREMVMAIALELHYDKDELLHAYINEVYLAQDGARAIHGFGLGSQFYFGKPLAELELHELALLVAQVRGPTYYNPKRHPERALARRNLVLEQLAAQGIIDPQEAKQAEARELDVLSEAGRSASYYSAFLDLVRRQLFEEYPREELERRGLKVLTTLDPAVQAAAESALIRELDAIEANRGDAPPLEGAVVVTNPHNAEVLALVGSRKSGYDGFNRALNARRPIGSLIKPVVYLAALESDRYTLASPIDDAPIEIRLENGQTWLPKNFDDRARGLVPLARALAESLNMATVRLGMDVGLEPIADLLMRLGLEQRPRPYPSLLLGATGLTPYEVAQIYNSLANGGFRTPLKAVRAVVSEDGERVQRYPLEIQAAARADDVFALNTALVQVMERGTGASVRRALGADVTVAGKTGTSDDLRDSWFAGFTSDRLVVAWVGNDDNRPTGLTGATGAGRVWSSVLRAIDTVPYSAPPPPDTLLTWIDLDTGLATEPTCPRAVQIALPRGEEPPRARACGDSRPRPGAQIRRFFRRAFE
ncbi:MAG TPA: penicillin-binding protein 1B [Gammaproteobacteria bacterium]